MKDIQFIVYTDMDGTLLDENYSYDDAKKAIYLLQISKTPIVLCTSKTRSEIEVYRNKIGIYDPFISENGAAIYIPNDYFDFEYEYDNKIKDFYVIELGTPYEILRNTLEKIKENCDCKITGFGDMSAEEVSKDCDLDLESSKLAKCREYDEAFRMEGDEEKVFHLIEENGLHYTRGGRYFHIMGDSDKGKAVQILTELYKRQRKKIRTIGLGDSLNDLPMLLAVDIPILVKKPNDEHDPNINSPGILKADGIGPKGWNKAILEVLKNDAQEITFG